jgi:vanillate O-demethylase ferredoxin subunit
MISDGSFLVRLARSGGSVRVGRDDTILDALRRIGIRVRASCSAGTCGTCETAVLAGVPLHRDQILDRHGEAAAKSMMVCCSRSLTPEITLDL